MKHRTAEISKNANFKFRTLQNEIFDLSLSASKKLKIYDTFPVGALHSKNPTNKKSSLINIDGSNER